MNAAPGTSPVTGPSRLPQRPIGSRLSAGHLLIILTGIVAAVLSYSVLRGGSTVEVAVAADDLAQGQALTPGSLDYRALRLPDGSGAGLLTRKQAAARDGHPMLVSVRKGQLVAVSMVAETREPEILLISVPVDVLPSEVDRGALVDVSVAGVAEPLVRGAKVHEVNRGSGFVQHPVVTIEVDRVGQSKFSSTKAAGKFSIAVRLQPPAAPARP